MVGNVKKRFSKIALQFSNKTVRILYKSTVSTSQSCATLFRLCAFKFDTFSKTKEYSKSGDH